MAGGVREGVVFVYLEYFKVKGIIVWISYVVWLVGFFWSRR